MTDPKLMKRYLLGTASADERTALENKYLSDADVFEELAAAENDLIDSYVRDRLSDSEKRDFEKRYETSLIGQARVHFSRVLSELSSQTRQTTEVRAASLWETFGSYFQLRTPVLQWGLAATCAAVVVLVVGSRYLMQNRDLQAGMQHQQTQSQQVAVPETSRLPSSSAMGPEIAKVERPQLAEVTMRLEPSASRSPGSGVPKFFAAPLGTRWLNVQLAFDASDSNGSYTAILETPDGQQIDRISGLRSHSLTGRATVTVRLPVHLVPAGDYVVDLRQAAKNQPAGETLESYSFRVFYK